MAARREFLVRVADLVQEECEIGERLIEVVTNLQSERDVLRGEVEALKIERKKILLYSFKNWEFKF